jgi:hypothetical protein
LANCRTRAFGLEAIAFGYDGGERAQKKRGAENSRGGRASIAASAASARMPRRRPPRYGNGQMQRTLVARRDQRGNGGGPRYRRMWMIKL